VSDYASAEQRLQAEEAKAKEALLRVQLRQVLDSEAGRAVLWRIIGATRYFGPSFSKDALEMAHAEGRRAVGAQILAWCEDADESFLPRMLTTRLPGTAQS
jgi:hypothetical protein